MNIEQIRAETPGINNVIHLNNAGASLMPSPIYNAVTNYLEQEVNYGGYEAARNQRNELEQTYNVIAEFINANPDEIALLENATAAWNMGFFSIPFEDGDRILTSRSEYASNYIGYLRIQKEVDLQIEVIPNDEYGQTSVNELKKLIDDRVKLISITHMPTNSGLVNPVEKIGEVASQHDCLFLVDACQSVGHYPVDVQKIGCDLLSTTGRKYLRGPRGTGFLYVRKEVLSELEPPFLDLHSAEWIGRNQYRMRNDARRFENWETNYSNVMGLKKAVEYADAIGIDKIWDRINHLGKELRRKLSRISSITVQDIGQMKSGIVTFTANSEEADTIQTELARQGINVNTSSKCSTLLDMEERNLEKVIRASVHYYNTEKEIDQLVTEVERITSG